MRHDVPFSAPGQRVGLLGGSFDPAHEGHAHITREALKRFGLDQVWWLVSPGNPLKERGPASLEKRLSAARKTMVHPKVKISDIEDKLGTRFTAETLEHMISLYPTTHFVWLMGADNLATFHHWDRWRSIMETVPLGVLARPRQRLSATMSTAAEIYGRFRVPAASSRRLALLKPPAWCFVNVPMVALSSTKIRAQGNWS